MYIYIHTCIHTYLCIRRCYVNHTSSRFLKIMGTVFVDFSSIWYGYYHIKIMVGITTVRAECKDWLFGNAGIYVEVISDAATSGYF